MKTLGSNNEVSSVELMRPVYDESMGEVTHENDLSRAKFDLYTDVGPSSSSRRAATVRALTGMLSITSDPETQKVLQSMAMMNMEGEGISEARDWFRKILLRMGVLKPTDEEAQEVAQEQANQPPDPNAEYLKAAAAEAQAKGMLAQANTGLTVAKTEQAKADTAMTLSQIDTEKQNQIISAVDAITRASTPPDSQT